MNTYFKRLRQGMALLSHRIASHNYEVSAMPCTDGAVRHHHRGALQKPCCTKPRAASRAYGDLTVTGAGVGWNGLAGEGCNASCVTAYRMLAGKAEQIDQTFRNNLLRIPEWDRRWGRAAPRPSARPNRSSKWCAHHSR